MSDTATVDALSRTPGGLRSIVHRLAGDDAELPVEGRLASFEGATGWLTRHPSRRKSCAGGRVRRLLDVHLRQLAADPALRPRVGREVRRARPHRGRRAHPGIRLRATPRQHHGAGARIRVDYPVAIDSDYGVWQAFANHFWPAVYLADAEGRIRYHHFGEGEYAMTEMAIQQLLTDAGASDVPGDLVMPEPAGLEVPADYRTLRSPETYLGYRQASAMAAPGGARYDRPAEYPEPAMLSLNAWAPIGIWAVTGRALELRSPAPGSQSASRRATSTLSWDRRWRERQSGSACSSTAGAGHRRPRVRRRRRGNGTLTNSGPTS